MSCAAAAALGLAGLEALRGVHPVFIEGAARADTRDAVIVGRNIARRLRLHWERRPPPPGPDPSATASSAIRARRWARHLRHQSYAHFTLTTLAHTRTQCARWPPALRQEAQVDDLGFQPELALVLGESLLLLRRSEQRDGVAFPPLARRAARDVHVRVEARGQSKHEDDVTARPWRRG